MPMRRAVFALLLLSTAAVSGTIGYLLGRAFTPGAGVPAAPETTGFSVVFDSDAALKGWVERSFNSRSRYTIVRDATGEAALRGESQAASSGLFKAVSFQASQRPTLTWEWRAETFPSNKRNEAFAAKADNDFAARVYAIFKGSLPTAPHVLQYVWDDHFPEGTRGQSPFLKSTKVLVVQSGPPPPSGQWVSERRNLVEDYELAFGNPPRGDLQGIGFMTDADNTTTQAAALYRSFSIEGLKEPAALARGRFPIWSAVKREAGRFIDPLRRVGLRLPQPKSSLPEAGPATFGQQTSGSAAQPASEHPTGAEPPLPPSSLK